MFNTIEKTNKGIVHKIYQKHYLVKPIKYFLENASS